MADSFGAIFCSLEVDADFGVGFGVNVTDVFSIEAVGKHALLNVHFDEQGFSFSETDSWKFLQVYAVGTYLEYRILNTMKLDLTMSMKIMVHLINWAFQLEDILDLVVL